MRAMAACSGRADLSMREMSRAQPRVARTARRQPELKMAWTTRHVQHAKEGMKMEGALSLRGGALEYEGTEPDAQQTRSALVMCRVD